MESPPTGGQARRNKLLVSWGPLVIAAPLAGSLLAPLRCAVSCQVALSIFGRPSFTPWATARGAPLHGVSLHHDSRATSEPSDRPSSRVAAAVSLSQGDRHVLGGSLSLRACIISAGIECSLLRENRARQDGRNDVD